MSSKPDVVYVATLDSQQILKELQKINQNFGDLADRGQQSFQEVEQSAGKSGIALGAVGGFVTDLVGKFIELGLEAAKAFAQVVVQSVDLASQLEQAQVTFTNIFKGDSGAAEAFLGKLNEQALQLGVKFSDLSGFAKALAPDTSSVEQFERLTRAAVTLEKSDPDKNFDDVRVALEESLSGNFVSLQERFDLPKSAIDKIKTMQDELGGVEGLIAGLEAEFLRTGQSLESFADTYASTQDRIEARFDTLKTTLGEPILEALKEEFSTLDEFLEANSDKLQLFAAQLGDIIAAVVDFIGTGINDFLADFDMSSLQRAGDFIFRVVEAGKLFVSQLIAMVGASSSLGNEFSLFEKIMDGVLWVLSQLDKALVTATQVMGFATAGFSAAKAAIQPLLDLIGALGGALFSLATGDFSGVGEQIKRATEIASGGLLDMEGAQMAALDAMSETNDRIGQFNANLDENTRKQQERKEALEADTTAELDRADAVLKSNAALADAEAAAEAAAEAERELAEAVDKSAKKRFEIETKQEQKRTETLIRQSEKREAAELKAAQGREKILFKFSQDFARAESDLPDEEVKVAQDSAKKRADIDRDASRERIKIEQDFQNQLRRLQDAFNFDAQQAEAANDAKAFLAAQRRLNQEREQAEQNRDDSLADADAKAEQQRQDLKTELDQELADVQENNRKKLDDLRLRLDEQLAMHEFTRAQEAERQALAEQQEIDRQDRQFATEIANFERKESEKTALLQAALDEQLAILEAAKAKEIEIVAAAEKEKAEIQAKAMKKQAETIDLGGTDNQIGVNVRPGSAPQAFAEGGRPPIGVPSLVGEKGPELFVPDSAGSIIPNDVMFRPPISPSPVQQVSQSSISNSNTFNLAESMLNDPVMVQKLKSLILSTQAEFGGI